MRRTLAANFAALIVGMLLAVVVYGVRSYPVMDRLIRPCVYYPKVFVDCKEVN